MKTKRNYKINRICRKLYSKYRKNVISLVTAAVLLVTSMPLADVSKVVSKMVSTLTNAISAMAADTYTDISDDISNGVYTIQNAADFKDLLNADPSVYQNITIKFSNNTSQFKDSDFTDIEKGLGTEEFPFKGTVTANVGSGITLPISFALFEYLSDGAKLDPITFVRPEDNNTALLAENVIHDGDVTSANKWEITADPASDSDNTVYKSFTSVIGNMETGAISDLDISLNSDIKAEISGGDNAGLACGTMGENASLTVSVSNSSLDVSGVENAGTFVGEMSRGTTLNIDKCGDLTGVAVSAKNAGGLVGSAVNAEINVCENVDLNMTGSVMGSVTAGGLFGSYTYSKTDEETFDISKFSGVKMALACSSGDTDDSAAVGSVFGELINSAESAKICVKGAENTSITSSFNGTVRAGFYGGVIGRYSANDLKSELALSDINVKVTGSCNALNFGGIIGKIGDNSKAYVNVNNAIVSVADSTSSKNNYGGLVGYADQAFVNVGGKVTVTAKNASADESVGGIVGKFNSNGGVLRLSSTTDLSEFYPKDPNKNRCQIVGSRSDALVYGTSGWTLTRTSSKVIDDMDWGGVLRLNGSDLLESADGVLSFDEAEHAVTINGFTDNSITLGNRADFARAALIMQHDSNDFVKYSGVSRADMLAANISLSADIDISDVGLTGFMRDNGEDTFTGTLNGNDNKFTMTVGTKNDKIVFHTHNGLFAKTSGAKISDVTLNSTFNIVGDNTNDANECHIGSVSAFNSGALTVDNVTANVKASPSGIFTNFVGGMVGYVAGVTTSDVSFDVSFTDSKVNADFTYNAYDAGNTLKDCTVLGGVIGLVDGVSSKPADDTGIKFNNVTVSGTITDNHNGSNARVGGLIAEVRGKAENVSNNTNHNNIFIKNVNIDDLTINANGKANSGGFFGHNWYRVEVTLDKLTVNKCHLNVKNGTELGGLVLSTTGYWKISEVNFANTVVNAPSASRYGMLAATLLGRSSDQYGFNYQTGAPGSGYGCSSDATYFELITPNGYKITDTKITIKSSYTMFDEIAARSLKETVEFVSNAQAIISIPAVNEKGEFLVDMDGEHCNTYQNQTKNGTDNWEHNPNSRYYYNIDKYKDDPKKLKTGGEKLMQWSTRLFAADNIKKYIYDGTIYFPTDKEIDLNGYSYYPVDTAGCTIDTSEFTFYNKEFNESENAAIDNGNTDNDARKTEGTNDEHSQHYMMQSGIFRNCNSSTGNPLVINGKLTLKGSIGKVDGGSGALVCGSVTNGDSKSRRTVTINGSIVLDDLYVNDSSISTSSYAPLLINKIGDVSKITIRNVSAEKHKTTATKYTMGGQAYAATSLIGEVGSSTGHDITLEFSGIKLAASVENSIFSRATLLESFQHSDGASSAIYNYTWLEDWGNGAKHNVTYGKEVSKTIKNVDSDGNSRQNKYYNYWKENNWYTSPDENNRTTEYDFSTYRPYVAKSAVTQYTDATKKYDEIDVNLKRPYLNDGCGTYSDPYIVDASTLEQVARVITGTPTNGWEVNYNTNVSIDKSTVDSSKAFCKGSGHTLYTFNGSEFVDENGNKVTTDAMLKYLCEAYYKINGDIVLGSSFAGLGGTSDKYAFRGVIVGQKKADGTYPTITNKSSSSLIRFSNGSVVKDLNIVNEGEISLTKATNGKIGYSTTFSQCYGGVIGVVFGGDNIIDNVKVTNPKITFADTNNSYKYLTTAGGYVGAIVYGGVIFRNMSNVAKASALTTDNTAAVGEEVYTNLFVNPYIGRVVNGFAIEEGDSFGASTNLNNGRKNYLITQFKSELSDDEKLKVIAGTPNTIEVPNAQALFMLSIISQSGMGYTDNYNNTCGYGHYTFTRNADYSKVGADKLSSDDTDYKAAVSDYQRLELKKDNVQNNKVSVMLKKYTNKSNYYEAKWAYVADKKFTVKLTGTDTYDLTNTGFRGINQLFNTNISDVNDEYTLSIAKISGVENGNTVIKLDEDIKAYVTDSTKDDPNGQVTSVDNYSYRAGIGLLNYTSYDIEIQNITVSGNVSLKSFDKAGFVRFCEDKATGGLIGKVNSGINSSFTNIVVKDLEVQGAYATGGIVGKSEGTVVLSSIGSSGNGVSAHGGFETGGLIGCMNGDLTISNTDVKIGRVKTDYLNNAQNQSWFGIGGVVGTAYGTINISNVSVSAVGKDSFVGSVNENGEHTATKTMTVGGIIGLTYKQNTETKITDSTANIDLYGRNVGGIIGQNGTSTTNYNSTSVIITNCTFGGIDNNSTQPVANGCASSGGIIGTQYADVTISKSVVKNAKLVIPNANNGDVGIGGYVGIKKVGDLKINDCEVNDVTLSAEDKSNGAGVGGVIGHNDGGNTYAYDILINKLSYVRGNNSVSVSNLIGWNNSKDLASKFIGVSVNNTDCLPDIQYDNLEEPTSFTAVHADYNGVQDNTKDKGEGSGTHVDINSPYVNINPSKTVGDKIFTGDFVGGNMHTIIKDAASYTDGTTTKSYGRNSTIRNYAKDLDASKLTTFSKASELDVDGLNDLPVLLIDDNSSSNITQMLAKYISVLTNCDVCDSSSNKLKTTDLKNVSTATYVYENGALTRSDKTTLTFNSKTGYFKVTDGQYDNDGTNRFTVITLDYTDPTNSSRTALRLHIPVFVRKVLDFSFQSYVISGTDYDHSHYTEKTKLAFESFDAPVTTYFKYSYYKTADEWSKMFNNGDSLLWNFDKELYLLGENAADSGVLTDNTKLTLIDVNNIDKTYHSTALAAGFDKTTGKLDLTKIGGFKPITMNDILLKYATVTATEAADGTLVEADEKTATVKTSDGKYYKPAEENDTDAQKYIISVTQNDTTELDASDRMIISESYYLTINIPEKESTNKVIKNFVNYYSGSAPRKLVGQLPTHLVNVTKNDTGAYVIANFFTQKVTVDAFDPEEITTSDNSIHAVMTSKITINQALRETFKGYKSDGFEMYQAFKFSMKKFDEKDVGANAKISAGASVNVDYSILNSSDTELQNAKISRTETLSEATDSYMLMYPNSVYDFISNDADGSITVKADLRITYGPAGIIEQFPERKDGDTKTGIGVNAASYVAYNQNNIENSSISANGNMPSIRYYRMSMTAAQLSYNVAESTVLESKDSPFSQLGVNAKDMTSDEMTITANAIYDLSALSQSTRDSGEKIQYTMKLYVKDDSGEYKQTNDISKYLRSFTLENATSSSGLNGKECVFTTAYNGEEQNTAVTKFAVKTGKTFEDQDLTYANYRVELTAVLLNESNTVVNGTTASDYVVYTNAKIETGFINS